MVHYFSERTRDRESIVQFKVPNCSSDEMREGRQRYERAMNAEEVLDYQIIPFFFQNMNRSLLVSA